MFMKKRLSKFLSILFVLSLVISLFCGGKCGFTVKAAGESKLNEKSTMKLESVVDKSNGDQVIYPWSATENPTVTYGDTLHVKLSWEFADGFIFDTTDVFTYQLPDEITFNDIPSTPIYDGTNKVGTFVIENNVIKINYTSATFCGQNKRHGSLTFSGSIIDDGNGKTPEKDMEIHFPGLVSINVHMKPSDIVSNLDIQKRQWHLATTDPAIPDTVSATDKEHVYRVRIKVASIGNNTNVTFRDDMYPGMTLLTEPEYYTDIDLTDPYDSSSFTNVEWELGGNKIYFDIPSMGNTDCFYVTYLIQIDKAMYDFATANDFIATNDPDKKYYGGSYKGKVSNRAWLWSDETKKTHGQYTIRSWGDVGTIWGAIDKWSNVNKLHLDSGVIDWELILKSIQGSDYTSGYVIDVIPANLKLDTKSVIVRDTNEWRVIENAVDVTETVLDDGSTEVKFKFSDALIADLKASENSKCIYYQTKVVKQTEETVTYSNTATSYYNGKKIMDVTASEDYTKPKELQKFGDYDELTAPNAQYALFVNPASLDLDPVKDELILDDVIPAAVELVIDSVKVYDSEGKIADEVSFSYDTDKRKMTFKLKDKKSYKITYDATVVLAHDDDPETKELTESNSANIADLYSVTEGGFKDSAEKKFSSNVWQSAASSSSEEDLASLNVIKHKKGDTTVLLSGAKFVLNEMTISKGADEKYTASKPTTDNSIEITTGSDGVAAFTSLKRGKVFMLSEKEAPNGYQKGNAVSFYAFEDPKVTLPTKVTYSGKEYNVELISTTYDSHRIYFANEREHPTIEISKVDESGSPLADATFNVIDSDNNVVASWTSTSTPKSIKVKPGDFELREVTAPATYEKNSSAFFSVDEDGVITLDTSKTTSNNYSVSATNKSLLVAKNEKAEVFGSLKFSKTITGLGTGVSADAITFKVYKLDASGNPSSTPITDGTFTYGDIKADGYKQIDNLKLGKYRVVESNTNIDGYNFKNTTAQTQVDIEVTANNTATAPATGSLTNTYEKTPDPKGSLKFTKIFSGLADGVDRDGVSFEVYKLDSNGDVTGSAISTFTYGQIKTAGYKQIDDLDLGKYRVVESNTNIYGYDFKNTAAQTQVDIEVTANNSATAPATGSLTNTYEKQKEYGSLKFIKTIAEQDVDGKAVANSNADSIVSKNSADNISFAVYRLDDNGNVDGSAVATFKYSDIKTDGYKQIDDLEVGKYRIVESNTAIDGYTLQNTNDEQKAEVEVKVSNVTTSPASVEITNTYKKNAPEIKYGSLKFIKSISEKDADGNDVDNSNSESIVSKSLANAITFELYKLDANGNVSGNAIASFTYGEISAAGYKQIDNLEVGKYRVVESSTDITGYNFKNADTEKQVDVEVTEQNTSSAPVEITLINKYEKQPEPKGSIKITKTITGPITENDKKNLTFTITDGTSEVWSGTLGDTSKFTEKSDGTYESVLIDNLDLKVEYTVTETLYDVTGLTETVTYKINGGDEKTGDTATGVKVTSNDTTTVDIKDVYDYEKFPVKVSKVDAGTGSEIAGAEIVLKDSDGKQIDKWTSTTTPHEIELPFGTYTLEETVAPDGYDKVESAITFTVDNTGKVTLDSAVTTGVSEVKSDGTIVIKDSPIKKDNSTTQSTTESTTEKTTESTTQATTEKQNDDDEDEDEDDDDSDDSTGDLVITVLDEKTKKPVPNAVITITRPDGTTGTYTTDENGQVVLTDVPTGDYVVTVTKVPDGYHVTTGKTSRVVVKKNKTTNYTEYIDTDSTTQTTTQAPNPAPGNSNNPPRNTSVRTGDDAAGKLPIAIFFAVISIVYIVAWVVYKAKKRKEDK